MWGSLASSPSQSVATDCRGGEREWTLRKRFNVRKELSTRRLFVTSSAWCQETVYGACCILYSCLYVMFVCMYQEFHLWTLLNVCRLVFTHQLKDKFRKDQFGAGNFKSVSCCTTKPNPIMWWFCRWELLCLMRKCFMSLFMESGQFPECAIQ